MMLEPLRRKRDIAAEYVSDTFMPEQIESICRSDHPMDYRDLNDGPEVDEFLRLCNDVAEAERKEYKACFGR